MKSESKVAVLGPKGTFTEIAAKKMFGDAELVYCKTIQDVFESVDNNKTEYGVVAIENSLEGSVGPNMDCLLNYDVSITKDMSRDIEQSLLVLKGVKKKDIKIIESHPHALGQCRQYLKKEFPNVTTITCASTASAMDDVLKHKDRAAIGFADAAKTRGLKILARNIQDFPSQTRFIAISKKKSGKGNKTSVIFALKDRPGALHDILGIFDENKINLTKIESRPSKRKLGEYIFFVDFESKDMNEKEIGKTIEKIKSKTTFLKNLGSY